jgi:eukaryotic-like serine/threonine-protein kinase
MAAQTIAGRYRLQRPVGRGGMGIVWLGRDDLLGREVAVKQVGTLPGDSTPALARALREARSSAALNHRNVVSIFDAVQDGDQIWLVMEYVPSRTLSQILAEDGPMPPERAAWIGAQVADGLAAAHARGTIHRDVKPGNILVTENDLAKIGDFGISRTYGDAQLTQTGLVIGTPAYFSPELARGEDPTPAADVWALGATMYAAVQGNPPYPEQANPIAMLTVIAAGQPPRPEHAGFLTRPIARMLDPDPGSRWSMADAAYALQQLADQHALDGTREATAAFAATAGASADPETQAAVRDQEPSAAAEDKEVRTVESGSNSGDRDGRDGRRVVVGALVLLAVATVAALILLKNPWTDPVTAGPTTTSPTPSPPTQKTPAPEGSTSPDPTTSTRSSTGPGPGETDDPGTEPATKSTRSPTPSGAQSPVANATAQQMVANYYATVPRDTETGWSLLAPEFQSRIGGYGNYRAFWSTIASVVVRRTTSAGPDAVDVSLTYASRNGHVEDEVRRIYLVRTDDGLLINDDAVVG